MGVIEDKTILSFIRGLAEKDIPMTENAYLEIIQQFRQAGKLQLAEYVMAQKQLCRTFEITDGDEDDRNRQYGKSPEVLS